MDCEIVVREFVLRSGYYVHYTEPQTFAFVKIDLGSCFSFVLGSRLLHSLYIQAAGYKD